MTVMPFNRLIFVCTFLLGFFTSCSKNGSSVGQGHMTMKIDGKEYSFNDSLVAIQQTGAPQLRLYATGKNAGNLQWQLAATVPGTYSTAEGTPQEQAIYQCTVHAIAGTSNYLPTYLILLKPVSNLPDPFQVTISAISAESVSGSFHGQLAIWQNSGHFATITDGSFTIPFKQ